MDNKAFQKPPDILQAMDAHTSNIMWDKVLHVGIYSKEILRTITMTKVTQAKILADWQNKVKHLAYTYWFCPAQDKTHTSERK